MSRRREKVEDLASEEFAKAYRQVYRVAGPIRDADVQRVRTAANEAGLRAYREAIARAKGGAP